MTDADDELFQTNQITETRISYEIQGVEFTVTNAIK